MDGRSRPGEATHSPRPRTYPIPPHHWRILDAVRYISEAGADPSFLLKALGEANGELRRSLYSMPRRSLLLEGDGRDEGWCLMGIAVHLRDTEIGVAEQIETIINAPRSRKNEPDLRHVDIDDIPLIADCVDEDCEDALEDYRFYRRHTTYQLWDISSAEWARAGIQQFRGRRTITEITRELYQHDLEHLWQAQRMIEALSRTPARIAPHTVN